MLETIDVAALVHVSGGYDGPGNKAVAVRNCPGGSVVIQDGNQLWSIGNGLATQRIAPGVTADQYCGGDNKK